MKVSDFVKGFKNSTDKEKYAKRHVVNEYINYAQKISDCRRIVTASMYHFDDDGNLQFLMDTPMRYMLFIVTIIKDYTDIEFDNNDVLNGFDLLNSCGADSVIISIIKNDFDIFKSVMDMVVDDAIDKERNLIDYYNSKLSAISDFIKALNLEEVLKYAENQSNGDTSD